MPTQNTEANGQPPLTLRLLRNRGSRFVVSYLIFSLSVNGVTGENVSSPIFFSFFAFLGAAAFYAAITQSLLPCIEKKPQRARAICIFFSLFFFMSLCSFPVADSLASRAWPSSNYRATLTAFSRAIAFGLILFVGRSLYWKIFDESLGAWKKPKEQ